MNTEASRTSLAPPPRPDALEQKLVKARSDVEQAEAAASQHAASLETARQAHQAAASNVAWFTSLGSSVDSAKLDAAEQALTAAKTGLDRAEAVASAANKNMHKARQRLDTIIREVAIADQQRLAAWHSKHEQAGPPGLDQAEAFGRWLATHSRALFEFAELLDRVVQEEHEAASTAGIPSQCASVSPDDYLRATAAAIATGIRAAGGQPREIERSPMLEIFRNDPTLRNITRTVTPSRRPNPEFRAQPGYIGMDGRTITPEPPNAA